MTIDPTDLAALVDLVDLVDVDAIARRMGVQQDTVHKWRTRHDSFPSPFVTLAIGPVWVWAEVLRWAEATDRL